MKNSSLSQLSASAPCDLPPRSDASLRSGAARIAALVMAHGLAAGAVMAQTPATAPAATPQSDDTVHLPEVVIDGQKAPAVSSPKFAAPLVDTPQTVSVIPQAVFNQQGATNLAEILRNTPGISFNAGENGFSTGAGNFSMRGFDTSGSVFTDGFRDSGNHLRDAFNLEQVEVIKGPAADNGRGSGGGYVNLVSKTPHLTASISGTASFGFDEENSGERYRATLDVNQPLSGSSAIRVNVMGQTGGVPGRDVAENNSWGFAPSLAFGLGTPTRLIFAYQHLEQNNIPDYGVPGAFIKGLPAYNPATGGHRNRDRFYGLDTDFDDVQSDSFLARIEHDFTPDLRLSNDTRFSKTDRKARFTVPTGVAGTSVTRQTQLYDRENESIANNTALTIDFNSGKLEHTVVTGLELSREKSHGNRYGTNNPGNTPITDPNHNLPGFNPVSTTSLDIKIDSVALYAYDTIKVNEQWLVSGGLRLEHYKARIDNNDPAPTALASYTVRDTTLGGKLGVSYKPKKNGSVYAAIGVSALPPGSFLSNPDISRTGDNGIPGGAGINSPDARTQYSLNYEIGTKWDFFNNRLSTTLALFRTEKHNVAITGLDPVTPAIPVLGYGKQIVQGIELGATGRITDGWSVFGGLLLLSSERKHSAYLDAARRQANPADYGTYTSTNGDALAFTPEFTANLWTTYRFPVGLTLGGGLQYVGESFLGRPDDAERIIPNDADRKVPDYVVFNALIAYEINKDLTLRLNVDNIFDRFYANSTNWNGSRAAIGGPRSFLLSADFKF